MWQIQWRQREIPKFEKNGEHQPLCGATTVMARELGESRSGRRKRGDSGRQGIRFPGHAPC